MTPTNQRLREIAERVNKATNGPWEFAPGSVIDPEYADWGVCNRGNLTSIVLQESDDALFIAHSRQDVPFLLALIQKQRAALEHIIKCGEHQCKQLCSEDYIPRGRHAPECPMEYFLTARDALGFVPENL